MAAKHHRGTATFIAIRATSVLLVPLATWFVWGVVAHADASPAEIRVWLAEPFTATMFAVFIGVGAWHMAMGMAEVIEDYIHSGWKGVFMTLNWLLALGVAGAALFAAAKLAF